MLLTNQFLLSFQYHSDRGSIIAAPLYEGSRLITTWKCGILAETIVSHPEFDAAIVEYAVVNDLDVQNVSRQRRQTIRSVGRATAVQATGPDVALPGILVLIDHHQAERRDTGVVISAVADDAAVVAIARLVDAMVVGAIKNLFRLPEVTARRRALHVPAIRPVIAKKPGAFNAKLSLVTLIQYDNLSEDLGINSRLRYNLAAGQDLWFVINHNMLRDPQDDRFHSTRSVAAAKIRYTFRY